MKFILSLALGLVVSTSYAADRCVGKVSKALIAHEAVANMYFDVSLHHIICEYAGTEEQYKKATQKQAQVRAMYKNCIKTGQDAMVAHLGGEPEFENFYATVGNQISLTNLPKPCERVDALAAVLTAKKLVCSDVIRVYQKYFDELVTKYKEKATGRQFRRICD